MLKLVKGKANANQGDLFGAPKVDFDFQGEKIKPKKKSEGPCRYVFTDTISLRCQHEHRVILADPEIAMRTLAELIKRGELDLLESQKYTQIPLLKVPRRIVCNTD